MSDEHTDAAGTMSPSRLDQFEAEVAKLKVTGGGANPERLGAWWGIGLTILGFVVAIVGIAIWLRNSLTRYLRYWIVRLVYEQREQTEQLIQALRDGK